MSAHPLLHDPRLRRLLIALPRAVRRPFIWLMRPRAKWLRLPLGAALIVGGLLSVLPVFGLWMLPLGALLLGADIPPLRRVTLHALGKTQDWWDGWYHRGSSRRTRG